MTRTSLFLTALCVTAGCQNGPKAPYPDWAEGSRPPRASGGVPNAYASYTELADKVEKAFPEDASRVTFSQGGRDTVLAKLGPSLNALEKASQAPCTYVYDPESAFSTEPAAKGWRLLGRGFAWRIERCMEEGDGDKAVRTLLAATKFGLDIAKGDCQTASLGFAVCNEARKAFAPHLAKLQAGQLLQLASGLRKILADDEGPGTTIANERRRMLLGVQFVQDCRRDGAYRALAEATGKDAKPAVTYLKDLDESKRPAYFEGFAAEAKDYADHWAAQTERASVDRTQWEPGEDERPWRRFSKSLFETIEPMLAMHDACTARTRLLALTAWATAQIKVSGLAPKTIRGQPETVTTDPYSGKPFVYRASGRDFEVYSVGANFVDDGGRSDEPDGTADLELESGDL